MTTSYTLTILVSDGPVNYPDPACAGCLLVCPSCVVGVLWPFDTFQVISGAVSLSTLFLGKPPRQFTST